MMANYKMNIKLHKKLDPQNEIGEDIEPVGVLCNVENSEKLSLNSLKEQYEDTFRAKDKLEDKAKTNIISVTISITLIMGASGILSTLNKKFPYEFLSWILFALFIVSVAYMLIAGLLVIQLLIGENEIYTVRLDSLAVGETTLRDDYDKCIALNQTKNTIRNNYVFTSYECIRNALVCLFIILVLVVIPFNSSSDNTRQSLGYSSQDYSFVFSSSAVDYLENNAVRSTVESAIIDTIVKANSNGTIETFGIVDSNSSLFIKFEVLDNTVTVLLIEPII